MALDQRMNFVQQTGQALNLINKNRQGQSRLFRCVETILDFVTDQGGMRQIPMIKVLFQEICAPRRSGARKKLFDQEGLP